MRQCINDAQDRAVQILRPQQPPPWTSAAEALRLKLRGRSEDDGWLELDIWGNGFLQLESGGTVILGEQAGTRESPSRVAGRADRRRRPCGTSMPRPISLGEVLAWKPVRRLGIALPVAASHELQLSPPNRPATVPEDRTVLSAAKGERFIHSF
jgi:hypothetical protein